MPFSTSKPPKMHPGTVVNSPEESYDSQKTRTSTSCNGHGNQTKPTTARTPSTRFAEPTHKPTAPNTQHNPSNTSSRPISTSSSKPAPPLPHAASRPPLERRGTTAQTRYVDMLLDLDTVPTLHNLLAAVFTWILLAGYIVFPATFNKLQNDERLDEKANTRLKAEALATARNISILYIAAFACGIGVLGSLWLWWMHRKNYIWVINLVFIPALGNSLAGLISTIVNVYTAQQKQFSITARAALIVTAACSLVTILLLLIYNCIMLKWVKMRHRRETKNFERQSEGGATLRDR